MTIDINPDTRLEQDSLGWVEVRNDALWGSQTQRALDNFNISGFAIGRFGTLISALAMIKMAAARTNCRLGELSEAKCRAIEEVCTELISGQHISAFQIDAFQGGAGTSVNMNVNEVIANIANERAGFRRGSYTFIHPNDDVNCSQSTNDVYPTAVKLSLLLASRGLGAALEGLADSFAEKSVAFADIVKLGRTQLQDAVPMTLGQEFGAFGTTVRKDIAALAGTLDELRQINLGGTAIGTQLNAPHGYSEAVIGELNSISGLDFTRAGDLIEASWDMGAFVSLSGGLKRIASKLSKISNDLRLLSSGPRGGLGEIRLPEAQPGSSIMPGKVNPVIPEVVNQVCFQVFGNDVAVTSAAEAGQLQLNAMEPLIAFNLHASLHLLERAVTTLDRLCVKGITANSIRCLAHLDASVATATALVPLIGYNKSAELARTALQNDETVRQLALERQIVTAETMDLLDPLALARPQGADQTQENTHQIEGMR